jgi:hypothetical protein
MRNVELFLAPELWLTKQPLTKLRLHRIRDAKGVSRSGGLQTAVLWVGGLESALP